MHPVLCLSARVDRKGISSKIWVALVSEVEMKPDCFGFLCVLVTVLL